MTCKSCGSSDTEVYAAEYEGESDVLHCYECGDDQPLHPKTNHERGSPT